MAATDYNANLDDGTTSVDIMLEGERGIEHSYDKELTIITIPKQTPIKTILIDTKKLKEVIKVTGWFEHDSSKTALQRKLDFETLLKRSGTMNLSWGSGAGTAQTYTGNITKARVTETVGVMDAGDTPGGVEKTFLVELQFALGTHKG